MLSSFVLNFVNVYGQYYHWVFIDICDVVLFIGGVVAATVEIINFGSVPVHEYGTVTRWIVMYPSMFPIDL